MSTETLPSTLDIRKAAARGVVVSGVLKPLDLQRFRGLLAEDQGVIRAELTLSRDEENRYLARVAVSAEVEVTCQRCLKPMHLSLACDNSLAVVWTDEQAAHLPRHLEPLILEGEACRLWDLVEDELILSMPPFSYHDTQECREILAGFTAQPPQQKVAAEGKPNPFDVLAQLKPGSKI